LALSGNRQIGKCPLCARQQRFAGVGAIIPPDIFLVVNRASIIELAAQYRVPTICQYDYFARNGGLVSFGLDLPDLFRRAAGYVDRILNGAAPAELPIARWSYFHTALTFIGLRSRQPSAERPLVIT
jgi:ABC-type uncharacterized transport system substrate-binding protein